MFCFQNCHSSHRQVLIDAEVMICVIMLGLLYNICLPSYSSILHHTFKQSFQIFYILTLLFPSSLFLESLTLQFSLLISDSFIARSNQSPTTNIHHDLHINNDYRPHGRLRAGSPLCSLR